MSKRNCLNSLSDRTISVHGNDTGTAILWTVRFNLQWWPVSIRVGLGLFRRFRAAYFKLGKRHGYSSFF
ncbi:Uncharacterised protein [Serratia quinivorans]|nr:Uncharacterised protein [Serratia quinivorans]